MGVGFRLAVALAALVALVGAAPATAGPVIDEAVAALQDDPVYVDPDAERAISAAEADRLRDRIGEADAGPMYIAILPAAAQNEAGGNADQVGRMLINGVRRDGTYAVIVGNRFRAASNVVEDAGGIATEALAEHRGDGVTATLLAFIDGVGEARTGGGTEPASGDRGGEGSGLGILILPLLAVGAIGFFVFRRRGRGGRAADVDFAEVKRAAQEDLLALAEDIRALDLDIEMPNASQEARTDYERALSMYEKADRLIDKARHPEDLEAVSAAVEEGRYSMAAAKARHEGRPLPERRPPCFFDPRHGPSDRDVEWSPPYGAPRLVPACEADAQMVERGLEPRPREVSVHGERMPYWNAPASYGPWAGGYFGGFGGLFPGLLIGSMLGGAFSHPVYVDSGDGDFGGGDFGGGDFGGGDFGDFGGGDFGGGDF